MPLCKIKIMLPEYFSIIHFSTVMREVIRVCTDIVSFDWLHCITHIFIWKSPPKSRGKSARGVLRKNWKKSWRKPLKSLGYRYQAQLDPTYRSWEIAVWKSALFRKKWFRKYVFAWRCRSVSRTCLFELKFLLKVFPDEHYLPKKFQVDRTFSCRDP